MRSLLLLPVLPLLMFGCSQNPHVDVASVRATKTSANAAQTQGSPAVTPSLCADGSHRAADNTCPVDPVPVPPQEPTNDGLPDRDGDGVPDIYDKCPDVPGQVMNDGCPIDQPLADRDGDGVPDIYDKCPDVPGQIYNDGCPIDENKPEHKPEISCPYPNAEEEMRLLVLEVKDSLKFEFDRSKIREESYPVLHRLEEFLRRYPLAHLYMVGHTDDRGTLSYNQWLSTARVFAVKDFLVKDGINQHRISVDARGKTEPLVSIEGLKGDALERARAINRRVDMHVRYEVEERVR